MPNTPTEAAKAAWKKAVADDKFNRGFAEWLVEQPELPTVRKLAVAFRKRDEAVAELREIIRPYAVVALGQWAGDDNKAHGLARSWQAHANYSPDGEYVVQLSFVDTVHATGHNEVDCYTHVTLDLA